MIENIFTFGHGQEHSDCYIAIQGEDKYDCRSKMREVFGEQWSFQYPNRRKAGVYAYKLKEICLSDLDENTEDNN